MSRPDLTKPPPLLVEPDDYSDNFIKFTTSGSWAVGDFFKINQNGYEFKNNEVEKNEGSKSFEVRSLSELDSIRNIGQGSSGLVQKVRHKPTGQILALKVVPLDLSEKKGKQVLTELRTLHQSSCPWIVSFHGAFHKERALSIVLEYMDAGSLSEALKAVKTIEEKYLAVITKQVLHGLLYLHEKRRIIHRDIKPSNILLSQCGKVKIADFGVSGELKHAGQNKISFCGTVTYMSPERIQGKSHGCDSDLWSLGLSLVECALGYFPYLAQNPAMRSKFGFWEILEKIVRAPPPALSETRFSQEFISFVGKCLQKNPEDRPSAEELLDDPWLKIHSETDLRQFIRVVDAEKKKMRTPFKQADAHVSCTTNTSTEAKNEIANATEGLSPSKVSATESDAGSLVAKAPPVAFREVPLFRQPPVHEGACSPQEAHRKKLEDDLLASLRAPIKLNNSNSQKRGRTLTLIADLNNSSSSELGSVPRKYLKTKSGLPARILPPLPTSHSNWTSSPEAASSNTSNAFSPNSKCLSPNDSEACTSSKQFPSVSNSPGETPATLSTPSERTKTETSSPTSAANISPLPPEPKGS